MRLTVEAQEVHADGTPLIPGCCPKELFTSPPTADLVQRACEPAACAEAREGWRAASSLNPPMLLYI